jgi:hypothetical protein
MVCNFLMHKLVIVHTTTGVPRGFDLNVVSTRFFGDGFPENVAQFYHSLYLNR